MNKIFRKAVDELEKLLSINIIESSKEQKFRNDYIKSLIYVLQNDESLDFPIIIDIDENLDEIIGCCDLSSYERGCVVAKIMEKNLPLTDSKPYTYIRADRYEDLFCKAGIGLDEVPILYLEYLDTGTLSLDSFMNVKMCKAFLDNIFFPDEKIEKSLISLYAKLNMDYPKDLIQNIRKFVYNNGEYLNDNENSVIYEKYYKRLVDMLYYIGCPSKELAKKMFFAYIKDRSLTQYKEKIKINVIEVFNSIKIPEEKHRLNEVSFYLKLKKYLNNPDLTEKEYIQFQNLLCNKLSESLSLDVVGYFKVKNTKKTNNKPLFISPIVTREQVVERPKVSRKQLKNDFKALYDEKVICEVGFDFKNYRRLLELLKDLNYADSVNQSIFSRIYNFAQKNDDYYNVLYERARLLGKSSIVDEILEIKKLLIEMLPSERTMWIEQLKYLEASITPLNEHDFDYEFKLMKEIKKN